MGDLFPTTFDWAPEGPRGLVRDRLDLLLEIGGIEVAPAQSLQHHP
jgi:hypothetical protein